MAHSRNHYSDESQNVYQYKKPMKVTAFKIEMIIFGIIFIYIIACLVIYFNSTKIVGYEVKEGTLTADNTYSAIALRNEQTVYAENNGYINYYLNEGTRTGVSDLICTIDESGKLNDLLNAQGEDEGAISSEDLSSLRQEIVLFNKSNNNSNSFSNVYSFKNTVQTEVMKLSNINMQENLDAIDTLNISELVTFYKAPDTGVVVYYIDGCENWEPGIFTSEFFNKENYTKETFLSNSLITTGSPIYKIINDEEWSLVINLTKERYLEFTEGDYIKVKFLKNQYESWGQIHLFQNGEEYFAQLTFTNSMITFSTERFVDIELITEEETGLKIPNTSIVERSFFLIPEEYFLDDDGTGNEGFLKESVMEDGTHTTEIIYPTIYCLKDGEYYVDEISLQQNDIIVDTDTNETFVVGKTGTLIGVYNINKGYADFREIKILYQNDSYSIVESNTQYGLNIYDYIALDASTVEADDFIY